MLSGWLECSCQNELELLNGHNIFQMLCGRVSFNLCGTAALSDVCWVMGVGVKPFQFPLVSVSRLTVSFALSVVLF